MIKAHIYTLLLAVLLQSVTHHASAGCPGEGPYKTERSSVLLRDATRGNRKIPVDIFYPVTLPAGDSVEMRAEARRFPLICFGHGFVLKAENYILLIEKIVSEGFIVLLPGSETGFFPSHKALALDLEYVLEASGRLASEEASPLYGITDTARCLIGHSMGGGAAILAAAGGAGVRAIAAITPYDTKPSASEAAAAITIPALIFSGSEDCITPAPKHQVPIYKGLASAQKTLLTINGGTHCPLGIEKSRCVRGEKISGCSLKMSHERQLEILSACLIPWLRHTLTGDRDSAIQFDNMLSSDSEITYERTAALADSSWYQKSPAPIF